MKAKSDDQDMGVHLFQDPFPRFVEAKKMVLIFSNNNPVPVDSNVG
jgi:hypothetical protein